MATMNLKHYARNQGISESTARRRFADGTLPHPARKVGRLILVDIPDAAPSNYPPRTAAYVCVTSPQELEKRVRSVRRWAGSHGLAVDTFAADEDGSHQKLIALLSDPSITRIVTDRAGFDRDLVAAALCAHGRELITTAAQPQKPAAPIPFKPRVAGTGTGA
jgi:putative resolvase